MIPSIETIVEDVVIGRITKSQAVTWLYAHAEGAANDLRDHFAAHVIDSCMKNATGGTTSKEITDHAAGMAYLIADAMLEARKAK